MRLVQGETLKLEEVRVYRVDEVWSCGVGVWLLWSLQVYGEVSLWWSVLLNNLEARADSGFYRVLLKL